MKRLYTITRSPLYKRLLKNTKGWHVDRLQFIIERAAYNYGLQAIKDHEKIIVEPLVSLIEHTTFTLAYTNEKDSSRNFTKSALTFAEMQLAVNQIIYS